MLDWEIEKKMYQKVIIQINCFHTVGKKIIDMDASMKLQAKLKMRNLYFSRFPEV